jgi:hypothetical protein
MTTRKLTSKQASKDVLIQPSPARYNHARQGVKFGEISKLKLDDDMLPDTSLGDMTSALIKSAYDECEETVLAAMAAGVPASRIKLTGPALQQIGHEAHIYANVHIEAEPWLGS